MVFGSHGTDKVLLGGGSSLGILPGLFGATVKTSCTEFCRGVQGVFLRA